MKNEIQQILDNVLPECAYKEVKEYKGFFHNDRFLKIAFGAKEYHINNVQGQIPQLVSLSLNLNTLELEVQGYGGCGGNRIERKPNLNDPKEKYLAMKGVKIPFRKPKQEKDNVLKAVERFAIKWLETLKENKDVLMYQQYVDYDELLK